MTSLCSNPVRTLSGEISVPGDKSISHRALTIGAVAVGNTTIRGLLEGDDSVIPKSKFIDIKPRSITKENVDEYWADLKAKKGA